MSGTRTAPRRLDLPAWFFLAAVLSSEIEDLACSSLSVQYRGLCCQNGPCSGAKRPWTYRECLSADLKLEPRVGAMLPCNVIVRKIGDTQVEVSAIDPFASMSAIDNPDLKAVAAQVNTMLQDVVGSI